MKIRTILLLTISLSFLASCNSDTKSNDSYNGAWITSSIQETFHEPALGIKTEFYPFKSALVIVNQEFKWDRIESFGEFNFSEVKQELKLSFNEFICPSKCQWRLIEYSQRNLIFKKSEYRAGMQYESYLEFNRV